MSGCKQPGVKRPSPLWALLFVLPVHAQEIRRAEPPAVPPVEPPMEPVQPLTTPESPGAWAGEPIILPALEGIVLVADTNAATLRATTAGVDAEAVPLANIPTMAAYLQPFIGRPASLASLKRISAGIGRLLREQGQAFVSVWLPPQDLTAGTVRVVVRPAVADGPVRIVGASHFSETSYRDGLRQQPDQPIDLDALQEDVAWINRNPFRHATFAAEAGGRPDSTRLSLRVREQDPLRLFAGTDRTGMRATTEERIFAGFNWGNAFGRGDQMAYQFRSDPALARSITHSGSYLTDLPWRHTLALAAAWSKIHPDLGPLFEQHGTIWQVGARYTVPLRQAGSNWRDELSAGVDFKYADNNLEFSATPVTENVTHIAQLVLGYSLSHESALWGQSNLATALMISPGNLTGHNDDASFDGSRVGAPASYAYFHLDAQHNHALPAGFVWTIRGSGQYSDVPLLGSEQLAGTGINAVRGYSESSAFGDSGGVLNNELHLPVLNIPTPSEKVPARIDPFVFYDAATLHNEGPNPESLDLQSAGIGAGVRLGRLATLNISHAWKLRDLASDDGDQYTHFRLQAEF